jgi:hypothetical protein
MEIRYMSPMMEVHELLVEGVLCVSDLGSNTEEWEVEDLSRM